MYQFANALTLGQREETGFCRSTEGSAAAGICPCRSNTAGQRRGAGNVLVGSAQSSCAAGPSGSLELALSCRLLRVLYNDSLSLGSDNNFGLGMNVWEEDPRTKTGAMQLITNLNKWA